MTAENSHMDSDAAAKTQTPVLDGSATAAILLMLLAENDAAAILKELDPDEVQLIGKAMYTAAQAKEAEIETALDNFVAQNRCVSSLSIGVEPRIRNVMHQALGDAKADRVLANIAPVSSNTIAEILRWMDPATLSEVVQAEHRQVGALILSMLSPEVAGAILDTVPEAAQADLILRLARLTSVPADALADLEIILQSATMAKQNAPEMQLGGKGDVAKIVNNMNRANGDRILRGIRKQDKILAQAIEDEMFVFDDLNAFDIKTLGTVLRSVDASTLGLALKGAASALVDKMLASMSARAAETIRDEMAEAGLVKRADVEEAQKAIIAAARQLAADGTIIMGSQGDDYV